MNIGFFIPSMYRGGAERTMSVLCNEFAKRGNNITLFLTENQEGICFELDKKISVIDINSSKRYYAAKMRDYIGRLKREITERNIEIVISFIVRTNVSAIIACRKIGIPVIVSERNNPYLIPANFILRAVRNVVYRYADGIVFQTAYARNYFCKKIKRNSRIIMNPMSEAIGNSVEFEKKDNIIISACRLEPQKNVPLLIEAFEMINKDIPQYKLHIYGEGTERNRIDTIIKQKNLTDKIFLMGRSDDVIKKVAEAKIFVLSSDFEGLSNALMEAMCVGTACVATDSPTYGNRDIISDGYNGFLVPVGNANLLAEKILELAEDNGLLKFFSDSAKKLSDRTNCTKVADDWEDYINKIVEGRMLK